MQQNLTDTSIKHMPRKDPRSEAQTGFCYYYRNNALSRQSLWYVAIELSVAQSIGHDALSTQESKSLTKWPGTRAKADSNIFGMWHSVLHAGSRCRRMFFFSAYINARGWCSVSINPWLAWTFKS